MIPAGYSGRRQIAQTATLGLGLLAVAFAIARPASPRGWLLVPAFWVFANFFEWAVHRYPMHRPMFPRFMYHNHAQIHHVAFTDANMSFHDMRDLSLIMMPWYTIVLLLVTVSPVAIAAGIIGGLPMVGVFYVAALGYFLTYETLHALYHVPPDRMARLGLGGPDDGGGAPAGRGLFGALRAHHRHHHIMRRMAHVNFNVTFPLADLVMGTRERPDAVVAAPGRPERSASRLAAASAGGGGGGRGGGSGETGSAT
jgi:hypothetical protein